jgi:RNA polymerase sigma-70 factor, ECF subfamily
MSNPLVDEALLAGLRQYDEASWEQLYAQYAARLQSYIVRQIGNSYDAEDIVQETMLAAMRGMPRYQAQAQIYTWLCGIAKHKIADHYRSRAASDRLSWEVAVAEKADDSWVHEAISYLPADQRQALQLFHFSGYSIDEVASQCGRSYKATESLLGRARHRLRVTLIAARVESA